MSNDTRKLLGVISDTHGLVRPQALDALAGVELILHAGDIGNQQVLDTLKQIAPVVAVRGNNDRRLGNIDIHAARRQRDRHQSGRRRVSRRSQWPFAPRVGGRPARRSLR